MVGWNEIYIIIRHFTVLAVSHLHKIHEFLCFIDQQKSKSKFLDLQRCVNRGHSEFSISL